MYILSSTDEAYNDMGTPYIELQTILLKSIALIQQEHRYFDIIIKPHPDSISRIDQTIQQSIVQSLIDIECIEGIRIIWPEEKVGNVDLSENADLCIVPHSTTIFEISTGGNCISACFADSPFATIADELLMPHDIYDHTLLCKKMLEMLKRRIPDKARKEAEIEKIILNYIFWNSISYSSYQKYGLSGTLSANIRCLEAESLQSLFYGDKRILENINERYRSKMIEKNLDIQTIMQENDYGYLSSNDNNSNATKIQKVDKKVMQLNLDTNRIESNGEEYKLTTIFNDDQKLYIIHDKESKILTSKVNTFLNANMGSKNCITLLNTFIAQGNFVGLIGWSITQKAARSQDLIKPIKTDPISNGILICSDNLEIINQTIDILLKLNTKRSGEKQISQEEYLEAINRKIKNISLQRYVEPFIIKEVVI